MTVVTGQLLLCDQPPKARIEPGWLRIADGHIDEIVVGEIASQADFGDAQTLVSPGFIDTHMHLPQFDMIGAHGLPLLDWLQNVTFPAEGKWEDVDYARNMTRRVMQQCRSVGTTGICAYATVHHDSAIAALSVARDMQLRGVIGQVLMDRESPDYLCRSVNQLVDETAKTLDAFPPNKRVSAAVTPRFAISCTQELLAAAGKLSKQSGAIVQSHLAETTRECDYVEELFDGVGYINVYSEAGMLHERAIFGHGIHLGHAERVELAESGATIAHCPTANSFLRSGTMNRSKLMADHAKVSLGSDIGAGYERSMVRVGRAMIESASAIGREFPNASEAWYQITAGNADVLGWQDAGRLRKGNPADIVIAQPDLPWLDGQVDPLSMLMFAWDDRWIKHVMLLGNVE